MKTLIVTGGAVQTSFARSYLEQQEFNYYIAADFGIHFFNEIGRKPDEVLGDFDSADPGQLLQLQQDPQIIFHQYRPEKDEVDTELALQLAIERGSDEIHILGGTGTRLDHVLGSVRLLGFAMERQIPCCLIDEHNRVRLINGRIVLKKTQQFGHYVSLIPLTTEVTGVTLTGFKYPLCNYTLCGYHSIGISNEILEEEAVVDFRDGILILVESKD